MPLNRAHRPRNSSCSAATPHARRRGSALRQERTWRRCYKAEDPKVANGVLANSGLF